MTEAKQSKEGGISGIIITMEIRHTLKASADMIAIRQTVFVEEQHFQDEFDAVDDYADCLVGYLDGKPVACLRYFQSKEDGRYLIGRVAVLKPYRHRGLASILIKEAIRRLKEAGVTAVELHSQEAAIPFYETLGFVAYGPIEYEEFCPHRWMRKDIS